MDKIELSPTFASFLKCLNDQQVEYLLVGGYAVNLHGYIRTTNDMDVWIAINQTNPQKIIRALDAFGFDVDRLNEEIFTNERSIVRFGDEPLKIEVVTTIGGVEFTDCYRRAETASLAGIDVPLISLKDLRINKAASGRPKDLVDLEHLPDPD